jgi:acetyl esterase/lipase
MVTPSRVVAIAVVLGVPLAIANCQSVILSALNAPTHLGGFARHADLRYGADVRHGLDVYAPSKQDAALPVVVFWYGGAWARGSKEDYRFVGAALAKSGYVTVIADYRLYPHARFPDFVHDGAMAVRWVRSHIDRFGGNPQEIFLMGHSAGAHIAATLAYDDRYLADEAGGFRIKGLIGLSGPYAFEPRTVLLQKMFAAPHSSADWQPYRHVSRDDPPTLLIDGTDDWLVNSSHAERLVTELKRSGVRVEFYRCARCSHYDTVAAFSLVWRFRTPALHRVRDFIAETLSDPMNEESSAAFFPATRRRCCVLRSTGAQPTDPRQVGGA